MRKKVEAVNIREQFRKGYIAGWRSVKGQGSGTPGIPFPSVPGGQNPYDYGVIQSAARAQAIKPKSRSKKSN
jgi:hypothetical protein